MRFIDEATIQINAGHGGKGCVGFRREKYVPMGGPDGGDGGKGGDVTFRATSNLGTLQDFRFRRVYRAGNGEPGLGGNKAGKDGPSIEILVPVGTLIKDPATDEVMFDFTENNQIWAACKGGRGGKGNAHFVSSVNQAPKHAQPGEAGEFKELKLELKLLADAALIGYPNAGKSTLISKMSAARPKIADYAFTTLSPNLGVVSYGDYKTFVVADIPGLIEGAHRGLGLGHQFLRHIERTRVLVHLLDGQQILEKLTKPKTNNPVAEAVELMIHCYKAIRTELELFDDRLIQLPEILVINKCDLVESEPEVLDQLKIEFRKILPQTRQFPMSEVEPILLSSATGAGVPDLVRALSREVEVQKGSDPTIGAQTRVPLPDELMGLGSRR